MQSRNTTGIAALRVACEKCVGLTEVGPWHTVSKSDVATFGAVTHNMQCIHTDEAWARDESPYGGLIVHAYLTLALIPHLTSDMTPLWGSGAKPLILNAGFDQVRFLEGVPIGAQVRAHRTILSVEERQRGVLVTQRIRIDCDQISRPVAYVESQIYLMGKSVARPVT